MNDKQISVNLSEHQLVCLEYLHPDVNWFTSSVLVGQALSAEREIISKEVERCVEDGTAIPSSADLIVLQAFSRGTVCKAINRLPPSQPGKM